MKYVYLRSIDGYETVNDNSKINFKNDIINFASIHQAIRYNYYAKDNIFEIGVTRDLFSNRELLKQLVNNGAVIKFYRSSNDILRVLYHVFMFVYLLYIQITKKNTEFMPYVKAMNLNDTKLYVLEGYNINDIPWDYSGSRIYGMKNLKDLPFKCNVIESDIEIDDVQDEDLIGAKAEEYEYCVFDESIFHIEFNPCVYIYSCINDGDGIILSVFFQGYSFISEPYELITTAKYETLMNDDWKYYSKKSHYFKEQFLKIRFFEKDIDIKFKYKGEFAKTHFTRDIKNGNIFNDLYFKNNIRGLTISSNIEEYKDDFYKKIEDCKLKEQSDFYLFQDRRDVADDNAEALYRYYKNNTDKEIYFVIEKGTNSWKRLESEGFNLIEFGSETHKEKYLMASKVISSHAARRIYDPFYPNRKYVNLEKFKFVFLQHGIIMGSHHGFMDRVNNRIDMLVTSTDEEANLVKRFSGIENVPVVGLARYDNYVRNNIGDKNYIMYAPSWNVKYQHDLANSKYIKEIESVLNSDKIYKILKKAGMQLVLVLHPEIIDEDIEVENKYNYKVLKKDDFQYSDILKEAKGLITDYSSLFFDMLYQNKFVIKHMPYMLHHENNELNGYKNAVIESFDLSQLEDAIEILAQNSFEISSEAKEIIRGFFKFDDNEQCKRNYIEIEKIKKN